jgi:enoyl-CoA hydratase
MATGETFDFDRALQLGLVNQVWDAAEHDEFLARAREYASQFVPPKAASRAVGSN